MSDYGRELSDKKLKALENKIKREYSKATKEAQKKINNYLEKFEEEDSVMRKRLSDGDITKKQYADWRADKLMATNDWQITTDSLNRTFENAREVAAEMMTGHVKDIYALSHNYAEYEIEKDLKASLSFNLYDADTVTRLMVDNPKMLPNPSKKVEADIKAGKIKRWNKKHIQSSMLQSVLQGESLPMIARRVAKAVGGMEQYVAIRSARTMTTTAESAGRVDRYKAVSEMGIEMQEMWIATLDLHTRSSHRHLDGERVNVGETFSNGLRYPGDLNGSPEEVYNCRCTIGAVIPGTDLDKLGIEGVQRNSRLGDMSYEDWKKERDRQPKEAEHKVVDGKDILETWERRPDLFDFEIDDVINAQGFDGLPRIVGEEEFDAAVKESGVICKRGYTAPNEETLLKYHNELMSGKWYVDCSVGGALNGQGMYSVATRGIKLSDSMERVASGYGQNLTGVLVGRTETFTLVKDAKTISSMDMFAEKGKAAYEYTKDLIETNVGRKLSEAESLYLKLHTGISEQDDFKRASKLDVTGDAEQLISKEFMNVVQEWSDKRGEYYRMDDGVFAALKGYDAISVPVGGDDFHYVILNRTKVIFKRSK